MQVLCSVDRLSHGARQCGEVAGVQGSGVSWLVVLCSVEVCADGLSCGGLCCGAGQCGELAGAARK